MKQAVLISAVLLTACIQTHPSKSSTPIEEPAQEKPLTDNQVMCTMDAMQCADGNWVGRSGSNCEFICPAATDK